MNPKRPPMSDAVTVDGPAIFGRMPAARRTLIFIKESVETTERTMRIRIASRPDPAWEAGTLVRRKG